MALYLKDDLVQLLAGQYVLLLGDSVQRSIYKDLVALSQANRFLSHAELKAKGEVSFLGDKLVHRSELTNGIGYREEREYYNYLSNLRIKFCFLTRVYNDYVEDLVHQIEEKKDGIPNVIILNSCLWDISRYGRDGMSLYRHNLNAFCQRLKSVVPPETLVIWRTTLPVSQDIKGGFMTTKSEWCRDSIRLDVLRANYYAHDIVHQYGYNVLDLHYHFRHQVHRQARDGVHWNMYAHRRVTNIILENIAIAWNLSIPKPPWHDDSVVNFNESDVVMNRTNVLREAYMPIAKINPPIPKFNPRLFYADVYQIPKESPEKLEGVYEIMVPSIPHRATVMLPTEPYPDEDPFNRDARPVRYHRRHNRPEIYSRPCKASELMRMRRRRERWQEEQMCMTGWAHTNHYGNNAPGGGGSRLFFESSPSHYSLYSHRY